MMSMPLSQKRFAFRRAEKTRSSAADAPVYAAPQTTNKTAADVEALRRILREHAARWQ